MQGGQGRKISRVLREAPEATVHCLPNKVQTPHMVPRSLVVSLCLVPSSPRHPASQPSYSRSLIQVRMHAVPFTHLSPRCPLDLSWNCHESRSHAPSASEHRTEGCISHLTVQSPPSPKPRVQRGERLSPERPGLPAPSPSPGSLTR